MSALNLALAEPSQSPYEVAEPVVTFSDVKPTDQKRKLTDCFRAAFAHCRHLLRHQSPGGRLECTLLLLLVRACAGRAAAQNVASNFAERINVLTGEAKSFMTVKDFIQALEEEGSSDWNIDRAKAGLSTVSGACEVYRRAKTIETKRSNASAWELFEAAASSVAKEVRGSQHYLAEQENLTPSDRDAELLHDALVATWSAGQGSVDGNRGESTESADDDQEIHLHMVIRGCVAMVWDDDNSHRASGWFHDNVLNIAAANSCLGTDVQWRAARFRGEAPSGLNLLQVYVKYTGQNWLVVRSVDAGSTAEFKNVRQGMLLYRIQNKIVAGLSLEELKDITLDERPLGMEFINHTDGPQGDHLEGDWRYENILRALRDREEDEDDFEHEVMLVSSRVGLHRRHGGNRLVSATSLKANSKQDSREWKEGNQYLNGVAKAKAEARAKVVPALNPEHPIVSGRALGCIPPDDPLRISINTQMNRIETEHFILACIAINTIILALQSPENKFGDFLNAVMDDADIVLCVIFSCEMVCRVYSLGLLVGPTSYLRFSAWNVIDFIVVMGTWFHFLMWLSNEIGGTNVSFLRSARALRPMRSMRHFQGIKRIMSSLRQSLSVMVGVTGVMLFCFALFATIGGQLFSGAISLECLDEGINSANIFPNDASSSGTGDVFAPDVQVPPECPAVEFVDRSGWPRETCPSSMRCDDDCVVVPKYGGGEYTGDHTDELTFWGFDDAAGSVMTLFIVTTMDEWPALSDPIRTSHATFQNFAWCYFAFAVLIIATVVSNLFIAVVTLAFAKSRDEEEGVGALSGESHADIAKQELADRKRRGGRDPGVISDRQRRDTKGWPYLGETSIKAKGIVEHWAFEAFIMTVVVINTGLMATEHHGQPQSWVDIVAAIEAAFTVIYTLELFVKMFGLSWKVYWESKFNWLDFTLVTSALAQYIVEALIDMDEQASGFALGRLFRLARLLRAARIVRLLKKYQSVMKLVTTVVSSWVAIANVCVFIVVLMCILAIMGMQLYGADVDGFEQPRENFQNFGRALLTVYQIFTGEDWSPIMFGYMHAYGYQCWVFFVITFVVTNFALANLFVAVILENFEVAEESKLALQQAQYQKSERYLELMMNDQEREEAQWNSMDSPESGPLTKYAKGIAEHSLFTNTVLISIIFSSLALALEGPPNADYLEGQTGLVNLLAVSDMFFFFLFWIEAILKMTYMGVLPKRPDSYFQDSWNCLDFFIVLSTTVDFVTYHAQLGDDFAWTGIFRTFRVLRPLRVVQHHENIRVVLDSLLSAAGAVSATLVLAGFFFLVFGILSLNLFKGLSFRCCEEVPRISCEEDVQLNRNDCEMQGFYWVNSPQNFDNFGNALQALFVVATLEGWAEVMNQCLDMTALDMAPQFNYASENSLFFVAFTLLGGFFITNLFVGVLVDQFMQSSGTGLMTEEQEKWARFEMMCFTADTAKSNQTTEDLEVLTRDMGSWRKRTFFLVKSTAFDNFISAIIIANVGIMLMERHPAPAFYEHGVEYVEITFMCIYTVEILLKVFGLGWFGGDGFWVSSWNKVDLGIVFGCWLTYYLNVRAGIQGVRTLRILRLVLEKGGTHSIPKSIVHTLKLSIPPAINVVAATTLIMFVFAVAGMQLYGSIPLCEGNVINEQQNFSNILRAMMFLYQIATGQDFISIVLELRHVHNAPAPFMFFASYYVMSIFVFLNLFVAVLLEKFEREFGGDEDDVDVGVEELQEFKHLWCVTVRDLNLPAADPPSWVKACFQAAPKTPDMPIRHLRKFITELPGDWVMGTCRDKMEPAVWFNKLLVALEEEEAHPGWHVEDVHTALGVEEPGIDLEKLDPDDPRRKVEMPCDDDGLPILDHKVSFIAVAHGLMFLGQESLAGLDYGKQVEHDVRLLERRTKMAKRLMCIFVHAWRANKYQPPQHSEGEKWFETQGWRQPGYAPGTYVCDVSQRCWSLNVRTARDWMVSALLKRTSVGWDMSSAFAPASEAGNSGLQNDNANTGPSPRNLVMANMQAASTGESREGAMSTMFDDNPMRETEWATKSGQV